LSWKNRGSDVVGNGCLLEYDRPQHDSPAVCVIAQQYSSATFALLSIRERKSSAWFSKMLLFQLFYILKIAQI
jgi:hypothetical protein